MMDEITGPLNMRLVALYKRQQVLAKARADVMFKFAQGWDAHQNIAAKQQINVGDSVMEQHNLTDKTEKAEFLHMLKIALIKLESLEQIP